MSSHASAALPADVPRTEARSVRAPLAWPKGSLRARGCPARQSASQGGAGVVQVRARDDEGAMAYGRAVLSGAAASDQDQELLQARPRPRQAATC